MIIFVTSFIRSGLANDEPPNFKIRIIAFFKVHFHFAPKQKSHPCFKDGFGLVLKII